MYQGHVPESIKPESQNFNFKLTGKFLDTLEVMEQPLEKRSLIHFMLRTDEKTFRKLYNKLTEEDQNEFKSFIIYNTTLMHKFCKKRHKKTRQIVKIHGEFW